MIRQYTISGLRLTEAAYSGRENFPRHSYERPFIYLVLQGGFEERYGSQSFSAEAGSVIYQPTDVLHSNEFHGVGVRCFHVEFAPAWDGRLAHLPALRSGPGHWRGGEPAWLAHRLWREFLRPDDLSGLIVEGLALELLGAVMRHRRQRSADVRTHAAERAREFINANFTQPVSWDRIAGEIDEAAIPLARAFRRRFGCGLGEYVRRCRVDAARRLMMETEAPLVEVALECGFHDQAHFTRTFRKVTGMTPGEFRQLVRK